MKKVGFIYDDIFLKHNTPQWHPECKERLISIINTLKGSDIWNDLIHIEPQKADFKDIEAVHVHSYVERIKTFGKGYADPDTYISEGTLEASLYAAGAVIEAIQRCHSGDIQRAFCAVRPPGHHAEANRAMGFCIFNNIAVGARYAQRIGYKKVFIIDFDVHHGNGTQHMFEEDDTVFYLSTHQYPHYPGTGSESEKGKGKGTGFTVNIPMSAGSGDEEYIYTYRNTVPRLIKDFAPNIILVSAGYDIHIKDPLSQIRITEEGLKNIIKGILSGAEVPVVFSLEGGYDLQALADSVLLTVKELLVDSD
jgi:acetoin utilization deacetylase AcuC-like enzyme